jgi:aspartyl-tRNA(Asn)/glutamyl-tRNA(Gln) amidotransferase subunit B
LGTKVEIKNLNSFKSVERAIDFEIKRQTGILAENGKIVQETRGWNADKEKTFSQRSKEEAHDYRYFPEPDLPPLKIGAGDLDIEEIRAGIGELPAARRFRFSREYGLSPAGIEIFTANKALGDYFEAVISELIQAEKEREHEGHVGFEIFKIAANYLISDLQNMLKEAGAEVKDLRMTPENFAEFVHLIHGGRISSRAAKDILRIMFETGGDPSQIMEERNLGQVSDAAELENLVREVIRENPGPVEDFKKGKTQALQFLVGKVMQKSQGRGNPRLIGDLLRDNLTKP